MEKSLKSEPALLVSLLTAAVIATVNVIGLVADWSAQTIGSINIAASAWVAVAGWFIRRYVKPVTLE